MTRVDKTESYLNTLPIAHQDMLIKYREHLCHIRYCIDENFQIIRKIIEDVDNLFENANQTMLTHPHKNGYNDVSVRTQDLEKVCFPLLTHFDISFKQMVFIVFLFLVCRFR